MALKDLIAKRSELTEEAIESIVKDYVRYDVEEKEIAFLPAASALSGKQKVLVYLVALQGWPIVAEEEGIPTAAKPSHIEQRVGISGGTLRPFLKDLKDRHLISWKDGAYSVHAASLADIRAELDGKGIIKRAAKGKRVGKRDAESPEVNDARLRKKSSSARSGKLSDKFNGWIDDGWFDDGRALSNVRDRFHREGDIIPTTSVPRFLLGATRAKRLERDKEEVNGKTVWVYRTKK